MSELQYSASSQPQSFRAPLAQQTLGLPAHRVCKAPEQGVAVGPAIQVVALTIPAAPPAAKASMGQQAPWDYRQAAPAHCHMRLHQQGRGLGEARPPAEGIGGAGLQKGTEALAARRTLQTPVVCPGTTLHPYVPAAGASAQPVALLHTFWGLVSSLHVLSAAHNAWRHVGGVGGSFHCEDEGVGDCMQ